MKSLIVDDEFAGRARLSMLLEEYGTCRDVSDGVKALEEFRNALESNEPYSLICLDIRMPGTDGHEVLNEIRAIEIEKKIKDTERTKIFMTTGLTSGTHLSKSFYELCDEYLLKPVKKEELTEKLRHHSLIS
jgi:two-component system chemotaxis response regulator CheY